jgi:hypothetical protein
MNNPWSHYNSINASGRTVVEPLNNNDQRKKKSSSLLPTTSNSPSTLTWSQRLLDIPMAVQTLSCLDDSHDAYTVESTTSAPIPRRNLADAFDELYVEEAPPPPPQTNTPAATAKQLEESESPAGVADLELHEDDDGIPHFALTKVLKRELSQELVNRVSFYGIVHDINKEATAMASNDFCVLRQVKSMDEEDDVYSPLVVAVQGHHPVTARQLTAALVDTALIDEERWLLQAIETRGTRIMTESEAVCPPTFLQAMGECEYENKDKSRTQLWKPSRSWWEAKSGKNPWIEPKSHNKRWR